MYVIWLSYHILACARKVQGWLRELACAIHVRRKPASAPAFLSQEFLQWSVVYQGFRSLLQREINI